MEDMLEDGVEHSGGQTLAELVELGLHSDWDYGQDGDFEDLDK